ncbi:alpha/beta fold hydrolase [Kitasatospora sp. NPDC048239]|uniref:alpha/beta fold hydrolase n=1 Tax=Kitasatospora sp. NPDC048239 TaxID=3364046 RepID=UPI0037151208
MTDQLTVDLGELRLAYRVHGAAGAPPLLLLHALGERGADWDGVLPQLAPHHRVYALDLRGHGGSDRPARYGLELMRDDVVAFLDALGLARVDLVGHSMGGVVAYLLAQSHPERVGRLVLEGRWTSTGRRSGRSRHRSTPRSRPGGSVWRTSPHRPWWWPAERRATSRRTGSPNWPAGSRTAGW